MNSIVVVCCYSAGESNSLALIREKICPAPFRVSAINLDGRVQLCVVWCAVGALETIPPLSPAGSLRPWCGLIVHYADFSGRRCCIGQEDCWANEFLAKLANEGERLRISSGGGNGAPA